MTVTETPAGYRANAQRHLVPEELIDPYDQERDALVRELFAAAEAVTEQLSRLKDRAMGDVEAFVQLSNERHNVKLGGIKGNVTLTSFDGMLQVKLEISDRIIFDEQLQAAKELVDICIHKWTKSSRPEIKALVEHAFQTDKQGKINTARVLGLTRLKIDDPDWQAAMDAIKDSMTVASTKPYIRFYSRDNKGKFQQIPLDLASV